MPGGSKLLIAPCVAGDGFAVRPMPGRQGGCIILLWAASTKGDGSGAGRALALVCSTVAHWSPARDRRHETGWLADRFT